jgi:hypothetical protein
VGTHHLEYGFPSTHSTNSVSIALLVLEYVARFHLQGTLSTSAFAAWCIGLSWYLVSIVFGRLYTGMHSITDCVMGVLLGTGVWAIHYFAQDAIRHLVTTGDWTVPAVTVLVGMILVHKHPQPVDDCPCFEDAIAFVSVVIGIVLGWWHGARVGWLAGAPAVLSVPPWLPLWAVGTLKLVGGVLAIFGWRAAHRTPADIPSTRARGCAPEPPVLHTRDGLRTCACGRVAPDPVDDRPHESRRRGGAGRARHEREWHPRGRRAPPERQVDSYGVGERAGAGETEPADKRRGRQGRGCQTLRCRWSVYEVIIAQTPTDNSLQS